LLELYEADDCARIGLTEEYERWGDPLQLDTVNGKITQSTFMVEVRLLAEGRPFGPICEVLAFMAEGAGGVGWRCSGDFLRQELFTATSQEDSIFQIGRLVLIGDLRPWRLLVCTCGLRELGQLSVCNCDKIGSSNNLDLDAQANREMSSQL
jgi:hypothetical protein